jgi:hypothetical protein
METLRTPKYLTKAIKKKFFISNKCKCCTISNRLCFSVPISVRNSAIFLLLRSAHSLSSRSRSLSLSLFSSSLRSVLRQQNAFCNVCKNLQGSMARTKQSRERAFLHELSEWERKRSFSVVYAFYRFYFFSQKRSCPMESLYFFVLSLSLFLSLVKKKRKEKKRKCIEKAEYRLLLQQQQRTYVRTHRYRVSSCARISMM